MWNVSQPESTWRGFAADDAIEPNIPSADMIASDFQRFQRRG